MAATAAGTLGQALKYVGYVEGNSTPWSDRIGFPGGAWCGMFVMCMIQDAGGTTGNNATATCPNTWYTPDGAAEFAAWGRFDFNPQPGDCIYFNWGADGSATYLIDHIGLVVSTANWDNGNGYVDTVEGNISNSVVQAQRWNNGTIAGFGHPRYGATAPAVPQGIWTNHPVSVKNFKPGSKNNQVLLLQRALIANRCMGPKMFNKERSFYGRNTRLAVTAYQKKQGWKGADADGLIGPESLKRLGFYVVPANKKGVIRVSTVQPGANNWAIKVIKERLWFKGFRGQKQPLGTTAGQDYTDAYSNWQRKLGYKGADADGHPGKTSLSKLLPDFVILD